MNASQLQDRIVDWLDYAKSLGIEVRAFTLSAKQDEQLKAAARLAMIEKQISREGQEARKDNE